MLEDIIARITEVTNLKPVVRGGNRRNPIEYTWHRVGQRQYRLQIVLNGKDLLELQNRSDLIVGAINDFGDTGKFNGSIELNGGGNFSEEDIISMVMYFDVVSYDQI